jgi:8-oxo-dGTP pyrophosphatase MutT (NUDIX family)
MTDKLRDVNLVYCVKGNSVLLGMKKRGFGQGKLNGYGGKVSNESIKECAVRELFEEAKIICRKDDLEKVAELDFIYEDVPKEKDWDQTVHVYLLREWIGDAKETQEMRPFWYDIDKLPLDNMWVDDEVWLPLVLKGKKIKGQFVFENKGKSIKSYNLCKVSF